MADIELLINKLNEAEPKDTVIQQDVSLPLNNIELLKNKLNKKPNKNINLSEEFNKINNYNNNKGSITISKPQGFDGLTDISEIENNSSLYSEGMQSDRQVKVPGTFMDGIKGFGNDILYGYLNSASSFYHTLGNIPGGLNKLNKYAIKKFGKGIQGAYEEDNEEGLSYALDVAEDYLKSLSIQYHY